MGEATLAPRRYLQRTHSLTQRLGLSWDRPLPWLSLAMLWLLSFSIFPLIFALYRSLYEFDAVQGSFVYVGLDNWQRLLQDPRAWNALWVTTKYVIMGLAIELILGFAIALLYNQDPFGINIFRSALILPMVVPPAVTALMFQLMEHSEFGVLSYYFYLFHFLDPSEPLLGGTGRYAMVAILLPEIWQWTPFMALILLAGLRALPTEPFEAAQIDGANAWQRFRYLTVPLLKPVLAIAILLRAIDLFRVFDYVYILTAGGPGTRTEVLSYYAWRTTFAYINWGYGLTLGLFMLIILVLIGNIMVRSLRLRW